MKTPLSKIFGIVVPIVVSLASVASILLIITLLRNKTLPTWNISRFEALNFSVTMQTMSLCISLLALVFMRFFDRERFKMYFRVGSLTDNEWGLYGPLLVVFFTMSTVMMMSFKMTSQNVSMNGTFFSLLPFVIVLAAANAWNEEVFTRFVIVAGLHGKLSPMLICGTSAIIFGAAHYQGTPGGPSGMLITGFVGWIYAKSMLDTKGLGWAWLIHFLGDAVIFGASAMVIAAQN